MKKVTLYALSILFLCSSLLSCKKEPKRTVTFYLEHRDVLKKDENRCLEMSAQERMQSRMCAMVTRTLSTIFHQEDTQKGKAPRRLKALPRFRKDKTSKTSAEHAKK